MKKWIRGNDKMNKGKWRSTRCPVSLDILLMNIAVREACLGRGTLLIWSANKNSKPKIIKIAISEESENLSSRLQEPILCQWDPKPRLKGLHWGILEGIR